MLSVLGATVVFSLEGQWRLRDEHRSLILVNTELVNKSKNDFVGSTTSRDEKIASSISSPLLRLSMKLEGSVPSYPEKEDSKLQHFRTENIWLCTGPAEFLWCHDPPLPTDALKEPLSPISLALEVIYFTLFIKGAISLVKSFCQHPLTWKKGNPYSPSVKPGKDRLMVWDRTSL